MMKRIPYMPNPCIQTGNFINESLVSFVRAVVIKYHLPILKGLGDNGAYRLINAGRNGFDDLIVVDNGVSVSDSTDKLRTRFSGYKHLTH